MQQRVIMQTAESMWRPTTVIYLFVDDCSLFQVLKIEVVQCFFLNPQNCVSMLFKKKTNTNFTTP